MALSELTLRSFFELLGSDAAAPGGGSAAAMAGSLGSALAEMVGNLSVDRSQYAAFSEEIRVCKERCGALRAAFLDAMERDADAFHRFTAALNLPKGTAEEKAARTAAIQNVLILCIESPLHTMELSLDAAKMIERMPGKTNANAVSDLGVAVMMLEATVRSAWLNVLINLGYLKDKDRAAVYRRRGEQLLSDTLACTGAVYEQVLGML